MRTFFTHSSAGLRPARPGCGASGSRPAPVRALLAGSTVVDVFAMPQGHNDDQQDVIVHGVEDPVVANANAQAIPAL